MLVVLKRRNFYHCLNFMNIRGGLTTKRRYIDGSDNVAQFLQQNMFVCFSWFCFPLFILLFLCIF